MLKRQKSATGHVGTLYTNHIKEHSMRSEEEEEHQYWYNKGYDNGYYDTDDHELDVPTEYLEDYGYGLLDGDVTAHPEEYDM